jgi:hypothetical protein
MRTSRRLLPLLLSLAIVAQSAAEASAGIQVCNEPTYTRTANNNQLHDLAALGLDADDGRLRCDAVQRHVHVARASVPVSIGYQDATSPPWPGAGGTASNWVCAAQAGAAQARAAQALVGIPLRR